MKMILPLPLQPLLLAALLLCTSSVSGLRGGLPTTAARSSSSSRTTTSLQQIRGGRNRNRNIRNDPLVHPRQRNLLHPMHHGHGGTTYLGCLNYTNEELEEEWVFPGNAPNCSYVSYYYGTGSGEDYDNDSDGQDWEDGNGGNGGNGGGNGDGGDYNNYADGSDNEYNNYNNGGGGNNNNNNGNDGRNGYYDSSGNDYDGNGGGNGGGNGYDGSGYYGNGDQDRQGNNNQEEGYVVTNEDVAEGGNDDNDYAQDPFTAFNITKCNTYDNLWVWDLAFSCESDLSLDNCECTFTEHLMLEGLITCDDIQKCPKECPVCETCFKLVGCTPVPNAFVRSGTSSSMLFAICLAIGLFLFGIGYYYARTRNHDTENGLEAHLIDKKLHQGDSSGGGEKTSPPDDTDAVHSYDPEEMEMIFPPPDISDFQSDLSSLASESQTIESSEISTYTREDEDHDDSFSEVELSPTTPPRTDLLESVDALDPPAWAAEEDKKNTDAGGLLLPSILGSTTNGPSGSAANAATQEESPVVGATTVGAEPTTTCPTTTEPASEAPAHKKSTKYSKDDHPSPAVEHSCIEHSLPPSSTGGSVPVSHGPPSLPTVPTPVLLVPVKQEDRKDDGDSNVELPRTTTTPVDAPTATKRPKVTASTSDYSSGRSDPPLETSLDAQNVEESTTAGGTTAETTTPPNNEAFFTPALIPGASKDRDPPTAVGTTDKSSVASDESHSASPWIGDIDLSEPLSFDEDHENAAATEESEPTADEEPESTNGVVGATLNNESTWDRKNGEKLAAAGAGNTTGEPTNVWLAPLDDLDDDDGDDASATNDHSTLPAAQSPLTFARHHQPSEETESTVLEEPSVVWLAPSSSPAELAPENKDDSSASSAWSGDGSGPWLAPL